MRLGLCILALAPLTLLAACDAATGSSSDSLDDLPLLPLVQEMRIGSLDDPDRGFSRIGPTAVVTAGDTIWMLEASVPELRVYTPEGRLARRIGRGGQGPGEFQSAPYQFGVQGDTVWTIEYGRPGRVTLFGRDGTLARTISSGFTVQSGNQSAQVQPWERLPDGRFRGSVVSWGPFPREGEPDVYLRVPNVIFDAEGSPVDTTGFTELVMTPSPSSPRVEGVTITRREEPAAFPLGGVVGEDTIWVLRPVAAEGEPGVLTVLRIDARGDTTWTRELGYAPRPIPAGFADSVVASRIEPMRSRIQNVAAVEAALREQTIVPAFHPPAASLAVTSDGSIWIRRAPAEADEWRWVVLSPDGVVRGEIVTRPETSILWSDGEQVLLSELDEFDVPWLVRMRIGG